MAQSPFVFYQQNPTFIQGSSVPSLPEATPGWGRQHVWWSGPFGRADVLSCFLWVPVGNVASCAEDSSHLEGQGDRSQAEDRETLPQLHPQTCRHRGNKPLLPSLCC